MLLFLVSITFFLFFCNSICYLYSDYTCKSDLYMLKYPCTIANINTNCAIITFPIWEQNGTNMHYIILDMEWNQPFSKESPLFKKLDEKLKREIIQIGAVKITADMQNAGEFLTNVKPLYYKRLHPHVRRLTNITESELVNAPDFFQAMEDFHNWCGEDCVFITWGFEDVPNLVENMEFFKIRNDWVNKWYNLQPIFSRQMNCEFRQMALKNAVDMLEITQEMDYHNAYNDAFYTAEIFKRVDIENGMIEYEKEEQARKNPFSDVFLTAKYGNFKNIQQAFRNSEVIRFVCPVCGKIVNRRKSWVYQNKGKYISLIKCKNKDQYLVRLNFYKNTDNTFRVSKVTRAATDEDVALYKEKYRIAKEKEFKRIEKNNKC